MVELVVALAACAAAIVAVPRLLLTSQPAPLGPLPLLGLFALDLAPVLALVGIACGFVEARFAGHSIQSLFCITWIAVLVAWRIVLLPIDAVLRPGEAPARLVSIGDPGARDAHRYLAYLSFVTLLLVALVGLLNRAGLSLLNAHTLAMTIGTIVAAMLVVAIHRGRSRVAGWLMRSTSHAAHARTRLTLARRWDRVAVGVVVVTWAAWTFGILTRDTSVFRSIIETAALLAGTLVLDRLLGALGRRFFGSTPPSPEPGEAVALTPRRGATAALFEHCARVGLWVLAAALLIRIWAVDLVGLIPADQWASSGRPILSAGVTLFVAYVAWRIVNIYIRSHMEAAGANPSLGDEEPPGAPPKNLAVSQIIADMVEGLQMSYPKPTVDLAEIRRKYHAAERE